MCAHCNHVFQRHINTQRVLPQAGWGSWRCAFTTQRHTTAPIFLLYFKYVSPTGKWVLVFPPAIQVHPPGPSAYFQQSWIQSGLRLPSQAIVQEGSFAALGFFVGCEQSCWWWGPPVAILSKCVNKLVPLPWTRPTQFKDTGGLNKNKNDIFSHISDTLCKVHRSMSWV